MKYIALILLILITSGCGTVYVSRVQCMNGKVFNTVYSREFVLTPSDPEKYTVHPQNIILQKLTSVKCIEDKKN